MTLLMGTCRLTHQSDGIFYPAILKREHRLQTQHKQLIWGGNTHPTEMTIITKLKHISVTKDCLSLKILPPVGVFLSLITQLALVNTRFFIFPLEICLKLEIEPIQQPFHKDLHQAAKCK